GTVMNEKKQRESTDIVTSVDTEKLMQLLGEYTQKLRSMCEERTTLRYRSFQLQMTLATAAVVMITVTSLVLVMGTKQAGDSFQLVAIILSFAFTAMVLTLYLIQYRRYPLISEVEQVA